MKVEFSRHAKRRLHLYNIDEKDVIETIEKTRRERRTIGREEVINRELSEKYGHPLKVIFSSENDRITVITAYPFIRRQER